MELKKYYIVNNIADVFQGYTRLMLRNKQLAYEQGECQELRVINWQNIKSYCKGNDIDNVCEVVKFYQNYAKEIKYMQKGDIVFQLKSGIDNNEIIYIDKEPKEKYIYDNTVVVVRVTDTSIDSLYVYIMCQSSPIQKGLRQKKWQSSVDKRGKFQSSIVPRLSKGILANMMIRELPEDERKKIVNEYIKLHKAQDNFSKKISELQADKDNKANICWL